MEPDNKSNHLLINCEELTKDILGVGTNLLTETAKRYITNLLTCWGNPDGKSNNFGYIFGLDKFNIFINQVNAYNSQLKPGEPQVEGIRVFVGRQEPAAVGVPREKIMDTVFLMPVLHGGGDLSTVQPPPHENLVDPDIILGDPRPCPNECIKFISTIAK
ncbi:hypothetical protein HDF24_18940 [Mucilaginibacter sp. X4EP1]|uniref:hypothetical protein n=1 Tax=Mucilaginibacter sp. X4EP1 TaxID=2723092 RepID=UPI00216A3CAA|nr:hypothetical protein [Mucilaginibacter sp. X4EP1]MCS3813350.1 hypothetical protein [Mucilaginibacter sp. X4EP1]